MCLQSFGIGAGRQASVMLSYSQVVLHDCMQRLFQTYQHRLLCDDFRQPTVMCLLSTGRQLLRPLCRGRPTRGPTEEGREGTLTCTGYPGCDSTSSSCCGTCSLFCPSDWLWLSTSCSSRCFPASFSFQFGLVSTFGSISCECTCFFPLNSREGKR